MNIVLNLVNYASPLEYYYVYPLPDGSIDTGSALDAAFERWVEVNPHLEFVQTQSEQDADVFISWVRDFGGLHIGYNRADWIEIGLGDTRCGEKWFPYSKDTIQYIAEHEIGHYLGFEHSTDPDDIMYPQISFVHYDRELWDITTAPGYYNYIPLCSDFETTSYEYQISGDDPNGFDFYFIPSYEEYEKSLSDNFDYYSDSECWKEGVQQASGTCDGISNLGGVLIITPYYADNNLITITLDLQEASVFDTSNDFTTFSDDDERSGPAFTGSAIANADKFQYDFGETINISGTISESERRNVQIHVIDPSSQIVTKSRVLTTSDGYFQTFAAVPDFHPKGSYTIVIYNDNGVFLGDTSFTIGISQDGEDFKEPIYEGSFKKFRNDDFTIQYPGEWDVDDSVIIKEGLSGVYGSATTFVAFFDEYDFWGSSLTISVFVDDAGAHYAGKDYLDHISNLLRDDCTYATIDSMGYTCSNHAIIDTEIVEINGKTAYRVTESSTSLYSDDSRSRDIRILTDIPVGDDVWSLDSITIDYEYPKYEAMIERMVNSFRLSESGQTILADDTAPLVITPSDIVVEADDKYGTFVEYSVKSIDDNDGILSPSCTPSSSSFFQIGSTKVLCLATDFAGNSAEKSFTVTVQRTDTGEIPDWVRDVAGFWCNGEIEDGSFVDAIQYMIEHDVMTVSVSSDNAGSAEIPGWVKNNACWWNSGSIQDAEFMKSLEFLIKEGVIQIAN